MDPMDDKSNFCRARSRLDDVRASEVAAGRPKKGWRAVMARMACRANLLPGEVIGTTCGKYG